jgi:hypothetical protein
MLIRSKKSCFAMKFDEEGRAQPEVRKNNGEKVGARSSAAQQLVDVPAKHHRRPCTTIAFSTLKWTEYEQLSNVENKYIPHNMPYDNTTCKLTVGGEQSADGTAPTAASTAIVEYDSPLIPWRARSRSLSSVSSVSLPSVFSMDDDAEDQDDFDRFHRGSRTGDCWNVGALLTDLLGELLLSFNKRAVVPAGPEIVTDR